METYLFLVEDSRYAGMKRLVPTKFSSTYIITKTIALVNKLQNS